MDKKTRSRMASSARSDWRTPNQILAAIVATIGKIALDPCASSYKRHHFAAVNLSKSRDGLKHSAPWPRRAVTFVNPPYGREIVAWAKLAAEQAKLGAKIVMLVPARVDTQWWRLLLEQEPLILFLGNRIRFVGAPDLAMFPSAIVTFHVSGEALESLARLLPGWICFPFRPSWA